MKYLFYLIAFLGIHVCSVQASTVAYFDVSKKVPLNQEFNITLYLDTDTSINTISSHIVLPKGLNIKFINTGDSVINFWIDKPIFDKSDHSVNFSGIIPGGFIGKGSIIKLVATVSDEGMYELQNSKIDTYANTSEVTGISIFVPAVAFSADKNTTLNAVVKDIDSPEDFSIYVTHDPLIQNNKWLAFFSTVDKGSGVLKYQISERAGEKESDYKKLEWRDVESPVVLTDQELKSYVYVKAVDRSGNEKIQFLAPKYPITLYDRIVFDILPLVIILLTAYITWRLWANQFKIK